MEQEKLHGCCDKIKVTAPKKSSFIHIFFISGVYYFPLLKIEEWGQNHRRWQFWPWNLLVTCATETGQNHRRWQFWPWNLLVTCAAETHICCKLKFEEGYFLKCIYMYIVPLYQVIENVSKVWQRNRERKKGGSVLSWQIIPKSIKSSLHLLLLSINTMVFKMYQLPNPLPI